MFWFLFPAPRLLRLRFDCNVRMRITPRDAVFSRTVSATAERFDSAGDSEGE